jgi:stringent starvation protein B
MNTKMTSSKPYLVRAFYEWILDNGMTPYIVIDATVAGTQVPTEYIDEGRIVLNIAPTAVQGLIMNNVQIEFKASFGRSVRTIFAWMTSVQAIYAKETGKGMIFSPEDGDDLPPTDHSPSENTKSSSSTKSRDHLRIVK